MSWMQEVKLVKLGFFQMFNCQENCLLELFALEFLDNFCLWPLSDFRPEKSRSFPPDLTGFEL